MGLCRSFTRASGDLPRHNRPSRNIVSMTDHDVRGAGPNLLLLGAAARVLFEAAAASLADEFTLITCSLPEAVGPAPSVQERADQVVALLRRLGALPATVYGHNGAAIVALEMVVRHPDALASAVLHDPPLVTVLGDPGEAMAQLDIALRHARAGAAAMHRLYLLAQDPTLGEARHAELRARLVDSGPPFATAEMEMFAGYRPDPTRLAASAVPLLLVQSAAISANQREAIAWLADRTGADVLEVPGGHWSFLDTPGRFVDSIRPFLRSFTHQSSSPA
jgi:pimeloyl-ACP methyl ester carboxylesterase